MQWTLTTFAAGSSSWRFAARRLERQARRSGEFTSVRIGDEQWIRTEVPALWASIAGGSSPSRGYGYWRWKPHLVLSALRKARHRGEGVVYLDAGCEINLNDASRARLHDYFSLAADGIPIAMRLDAPLAAWCKREALDHFAIRDVDALTTPVVEAGVLVMAPTARNIKLIETWADCSAIDNGFLFDDVLDPARQLETFQEHRHDQAVFSCLMHEAGEVGIASETYFGPNWMPAGHDFPIWAIRNRFPFSRRPKTIGGTAISLGRGLRDLSRRS